jgi:GT2 family glycosyltransferase
MGLSAMMSLMTPMPTIKPSKPSDWNVDGADAPTSLAVSVVIVTYNSRPYIDACLESLAATLPPAAEIVVVDNASSDGTAAHIAAQHPAVKLIAHADNSGFAVGNNLGVAHASGDYIAFINPDTTVTPGWLEAMIAVLDDDPSVGMVTPKILLMNPPDQVNTCGNTVHLTGLTLCRGVGADRDDPTLNVVSEVNAISGAAFVMRRALYEELGGFDALLFMYMEDTDLSLRARQRGYKCFYTPHAVIYHDYRLRFGPRKTFYQERNRYIMLLKLFDWRTLALLLPALLLAEAVTWGFTLLKDRRNARNKPAAYRAIIREWRVIMARRAETQLMRRVSDRDLLSGLSYMMEFEQTGRNLTSTLAHLIFDPLFWTMQRFILLIVRW